MPWPGDHLDPDWLPTTGPPAGVPVVVILGCPSGEAMPCPDRSSVAGRRLPPSPEPRHVAAWTVGLRGGRRRCSLTFDAGLRHGLIVSMMFALLTLSVVVVTGFTGQISLAQLALAGIAGFASIRLADQRRPLPDRPARARRLATVVGVAVGWPATRVRGMSLAVATLAMAVALENWSWHRRASPAGTPDRSAPRPYLFGSDVGIEATGADNFRPAFGFVCLAVLVLAAVAVANLRRNRTGLRWLAVRANERAAAAAGIDVRSAKLGAFAVSSFLAGLCGVLTAYSVTTLSPSSFLVIGALVAVALTYLAGVSAISGALVAGALAQAGLVTAAMSGARAATPTPTCSPSAASP